MESLTKSLQYLETEPRVALSVRQRCLRVLTMVACCWSLVGSGTMFYALGHEGSLRARVVGIAALTIGAGIISVVLPLSFVLREDTTK